MIVNYFNRCDSVLVVYDITHRESFENLNFWLIIVKKIEIKIF